MTDKHDTAVLKRRRILTAVAGTIAITSGCSTAQSSKPTTTADKTTTETPPVSFDGEPIQQTFRFDQGSDYPQDWEWPIEVEFQRPEAGNWTETHSFNVDRGDPVTVELLAEQHYMIVVEDADGDRRKLGLYTPMKPGEEVSVLIGGCCVDDF